MMPGDGHDTALAEIAAEMGSGGAHTPERSENSLGDLFLEIDSEVANFAGHAIAPPKRGPGRPAGSPNRTTQQLQAWLRGRSYRDPAEFLAAIVTMDARQLAGELKGKPVETVSFDEAEAVLKLQKGAAAELMPYFHQRMPQQVEQVGDAARPLILIMQGNQGVNAKVIDGSHGAGSHDGSQVLDLAGQSGGSADD